MEIWLGNEFRTELGLHTDFPFKEIANLDEPSDASQSGQPHSRRYDQPLCINYLVASLCLLCGCVLRANPVCIWAAFNNYSVANLYTMSFADHEVQI